QNCSRPALQPCRPPPPRLRPPPLRPPLPSPPPPHRPSSMNHLLGLNRELRSRWRTFGRVTLSGMALWVAPVILPRAPQATSTNRQDLASARSLAASGQIPEAIAAYQPLLMPSPTNGAPELARAARHP